MKCGDEEGTVGEYKFGVTGGSESQRSSDERVLPDGFTLMRLRRYCG